MSKCLIVNDMQACFIEGYFKSNHSKLIHMLSSITDFRSKGNSVYYPYYDKKGNFTNELCPVKDTEFLFKNSLDGFFNSDGNTYESHFASYLEPYKEICFMGSNFDSIKLTADSAIRLGHKVRFFKDCILSDNISFFDLLPYYFKKGFSVSNYKSKYAIPE